MNCRYWRRGRNVDGGECLLARYHRPSRGVCTKHCIEPGWNRQMGLGDTVRWLISLVLHYTPIKAALQLRGRACARRQDWLNHRLSYAPRADKKPVTRGGCCSS